MAIRKIREIGDDVLEKVCKEVTDMTDRTKVLIEDMLDTMYDAMGVGLAAPQVGILKRIVVIDIGEGPIILVNPEILETAGEQTGEEGCLSLPGKSGTVTRPNYVKVKANFTVWSMMMSLTRKTKEETADESNFYGDSGFFSGYFRGFDRGGTRCGACCDTAG